MIDDKTQKLIDKAYNQGIKDSLGAIKKTAADIVLAAKDAENKPLAKSAANIGKLISAEVKNLLK